jgi:amino acid adenylation domain-containing protein
VEQRKLLCEWNTTEMDLPKVASIHESIQQKARECPHAIAVICRDKQLTYSELNARADKLAAQLCDLGVREETLVGICVERSVEMVIGLLGILKSGGTYVPLDPTYPKERIAFMLEDSNPLVLLSESALVDVIPETNAHVLCIDTIDWADTRDSDHLGHASRLTTHEPLHASPLAYVIYTSGSTGKPKGVMVEHGNVLNFFAAMDNCIMRGSRTGDSCGGAATPGIWLAVTSPSFDISVLELFWTLSRGFKVVVYAGEESRQIKNRKSQIANPQQYSIPALIQRHGVTHLQCTPSMASMLLLDEPTRQALGQLQSLLIGGEAFPARLARELSEVFKGALLNMYGPTETTVWSTTWQLPADSVPSCIPVGRPIANTQIYIVDPELRPVPIGVEGELLIGGAGVARGYLDREKLTAERFIPTPFSADGGACQPSGARLYRTGDLARYLPDGNIELLGRLDHQVKIGGHRVELGEIEASLNEHPAVHESVVLFRELDKEKMLVAYIIPRGDEKPMREQFREHVATKLPEYMVPSHFMYMTAFPQTPNRKIDRNAFPSPQSEMPEDRREQPAASVEEALAALWKDLLGLKRVGRQDNFFESGGHSLLAMQLVAKIQKRFNIDFPLRNIFECQTLAGMAELIEAMSWSEFVKVPRSGEREVIDV